MRSFVGKCALDDPQGGERLLLRRSMKGKLCWQPAAKDVPVTDW